MFMKLFKKHLSSKIRIDYRPSVRAHDLLGPGEKKNLTELNWWVKNQNIRLIGWTDVVAQGIHQPVKKIQMFQSFCLETKHTPQACHLIILGNNQSLIKI